MNTAAFEYHRPTTVDEAVSLLQRYGGDARPLAGGQSLLAMMKLRMAEPTALVDLSRIPGLSGIRQDGDRLILGAMTTHYSVLSSPLVQQLAPILAETAAHIGDPQVRNRGTLGGSLAHADPGADIEAAILASEGTLQVVGPKGSRSIPANEFFLDMLTTTLESDELITEVSVPVQPPGQGGAYEKFPHPASRFALVGVAALVAVQADRVVQARVALTGAARSPLRLLAVESRLAEQPVATIAEAAALAADGWDPNDDIHASADYRRHLATVLTARALTRAVAVARGEATPRFAVL